MQKYQNRTLAMNLIIYRSISKVIIHFSIFTGKYLPLNYTKQTFITAFALFSLFFGAGNLILPPYIGHQAGAQWLWVALGFCLSAVVIPIMAIYGYARIQGSLFDFSKNMGRVGALIYAIIIYLIAISLPGPRTASVTYEMAIAPFDLMNSWSFSTLYFLLVLLFVLNRSKILDLIGKYLTPLIVLILLMIIGIGLFIEVPKELGSATSLNLFSGILEGYQTFDAIGGVVVGGVIVISIGLKGVYTESEKKSIISKAGLWAGMGLLGIYIGLIALGAHFSGTSISTRTELLSFLSSETLGNVGATFLAVLVGLACFTTAVGIVTGASDFVKGQLGNSQHAYTVTAVVSCIIGILVGGNQVQFIIDLAVPALMFIYPVTIILIILNTLPKKWATKNVFKWVIAITLLFSIPDFLGIYINAEWFKNLIAVIPFSNEHLGWILPAGITFFLLTVLRKK